jgi:hypothetical protein
MKKVLLFFVTLLAQHLTAQELYLQTGRNYTSYNFKTAEGVSVPFFDGKNRSHFYGGSSFEISYVFKKKELSPFAYMVGLTLNQFNGKYFISGNTDASTWKTDYLGVQGSVSYVFIKVDSGIDFSLKGGLNVAHFISGEQYTNKIYYDLAKQVDFKGVVLQPLIGINVKCEVSNICSLSLGYNVSKVVNITSKSKETLGYNNSQLQLGIHIPINQVKEKKSNNSK